MARRRFHPIVGLIGLMAMVLASCAPAAPSPTVAPPKPAESKPAAPAATAPAPPPTQAPAAQAPAPQPTVAAAPQPATAPAAAKPTGTPIKIGLVTAMSGVNAALAQDQLRGGQLAVKQINAEGGVLGRPVVLLDRDDKLNPQEAAKQAELLVTNDKVDALTGCVSGATTLALNEIAKRANVVHLGTCQSNQLNKKPDIGPYTFHLALTPWLNQQIVLPWITQNLGKKVFVLYYDFAWGHENFESIDKWSKVNNIQLAGAIKTPFPTGDFTPLIPQIANAKPDVLLAMVSGSDQAGFLKQAQGFGLPKQMKIVNAVADLAWDKEAGFGNIDGHYGGMNFSWELQDKSPTAKAYVEAFAKEFNSPPGGYSAYQYSAIRAYIDAVKKAGSADPAKVVPALEGMSFDYGVGKSFIRKCDHQLFQPVHIGKGRSEAAAKTVKGWPAYAFREFVTSLEPSEQNERTCQELVGG